MTRITIRWPRVLLMGACSLLLWAMLATVPAHAAQYTDLEGHWAKAAIERWSSEGVLQGYADSTFRPNNTVTRAELASVLYRMTATPFTKCFTYEDVPETAWFYESLTTMNAYKIALNTNDKMYPNAPLTREEAIFMIGNAFAVEHGGDYFGQRTYGIVDRADVTPYFGECIYSMYTYKYISGDQNKRLNPKRSITRAEVITILDNMFDLYIAKPGAYTLEHGKSALINCKDVTLEILPPATSVKSTPSRVFLMNDGALNGVHFTASQTIKNSLGIEIFSRAAAKPTWTKSGKVYLTTESTFYYPDGIPCDSRFAAGTGSKSYPYIVKTPEQFMIIEEHLQTRQAYFYYKLLNDITLPERAYPMGPEEQGVPEITIDGNGHTLTYSLKNNNYDKPQAGLFYIWDGYLNNLTLAGTLDLNVSQAAVNRYQELTVGGWSGQLEGRFENCTAKVDMNVQFSAPSDWNVTIGGLVGRAKNGALVNCVAAGTVSATDAQRNCHMDVGGLLGRATNIKGWGISVGLENCGASGTVLANGSYFSCAGGLVGRLTLSAPDNGVIPAENLGNILNCWSTATVASTGASFQSEAGGIVGGLVGGSVRTSWAAPAVSVDGSASYQNLGAIAGSGRESALIADCWANVSRCTVLESNHAGGITGRLTGPLSNCFTVGASAFDAENKIVYGAWNDGTVTSCIDLSAPSKSVTDRFFADCGWDFTKVWGKTAALPLLRDCDAAQQQAAQKT